MPPFVQMQQPHWNRFLRQLKVAAGDVSEVKHLWAKILEPMRAEWARRLPGSLKKTVKVRKKAQGEIWAGHRSIGRDRPFLPWLEFGGRIGFEPGPLKKGERVPMYGFRTVYSVYRTREPDGRWLAPTVAGKKDAIAAEFAEGIEEIFQKHFR
jgi:hypothetical protein